MNRIQACFIFILLVLVPITESFVCARLCTFIGISINSSLSVDACNTINQTTAQCSVFMRMDHQKRIATGSLGIEDCTDTPSFRTETLVKIDSSLFSFFRYVCMYDNCDSEFLAELFPLANNIPQMTTTLIQADITDLIYNLTLHTDKINCTNTSSCSSGHLCQVKFEINENSNNTDIEFKLTENSTCVSRLRDDYLLNIKKNYWSNGTQTTEMIFRCNLDDCINATTANSIYMWIQNKDIIPSFNSIVLDSNKTCPSRESTGTSSVILSNGLIIFATIFLLSY